MTHATAALTGPGRLSPTGLLTISARLWFVVAAAGHLAFLVYIVGYYGVRLMGGGAAALADTHLPGGFVPGETLGNAAVVAHLVLAVIVIGGGPLQLIPAIRSRFPAFHRGLGRTYVLAAVTTAVAGLYMIRTRGTISGLLGEIGISLDGVLIIVFAVIAARYAMKRNITRHRQWALRLFLVASGVWFFRVGLMSWMTITGGLGVDFKTFTGPFLDFWVFGQYILPLALLELYFRAQRSSGDTLKLTTSAVLLLFTVVMGVGIFAATMGMWLPRL